MMNERTLAMRPDPDGYSDESRPPVEPSLAQLMDMLGASDDADLAWLFDRPTPIAEEE